MNNYYVYVYLNPLKRGNYCYNRFSFLYEPFYVGKGKNNRCLEHLIKVKKNYKNNKNNLLKIEVIKNILEFELEPIIIKIYDNLTEDDALNLEENTIKELGRINMNNGLLTNMNDGGKNPQKNYIHSDDVKQKISISLKKVIKNDYIIISPDNIIYENINLTNFCIEYDLNYYKIFKNRNKGKIKIRQITKNIKESTLNTLGWELISNKNKIPIKKIKYIINCPNKIEYKLYKDELIEFCNKNNICMRTLNRYRNKGVIKIKHKKTASINVLNTENWEMINIQKNEISKVEIINYDIISPNNTIYNTMFLTNFCKEHNLNLRTMRSFLNRGIIQQKIRKNYKESILNCQGWEIKKILN